MSLMLSHLPANKVAEDGQDLELLDSTPYEGLPSRPSMVEATARCGQTIRRTTGDRVEA